MESLIGGIFIDSGYSSSFKFIKNIWNPYLDLKASNEQDPKTHLQEISQQKYKILPIYKLLKKDGLSHSPIFTISLEVPGLKTLKSKGKSIREAEKEAAKKREEAERKAKEKAAELAKKAQEERAVNEVVLLEANAKVQVQVTKQEEEEKKQALITPPTTNNNTGTISGSSSIKIKSKNKGRHLYEKPNKKKKGKGPQLKKRIVF